MGGAVRQKAELEVEECGWSYLAGTKCSTQLCPYIGPVGLNGVSRASKVTLDSM